MTELASRVGERIRRYRTERGMTQEQLSESAAISVSYLSMMERGSRIPRLETLLDIAIALRVELVDLLRNVDRR